MSWRRIRCILIVFGILAVIAAVVLGPPLVRARQLQLDAENMEQRTHQRVDELWKRVLQSMRECQTEAPLHDLTLDAVSLLRTIPGVADVTHHHVQTPSARVIHLLDYPFTAFEDFAADNPQLSYFERRPAYQLLQRKVALVQAEQFCVLAALAANHKVKHAWTAGMTPETVKEFEARLETVKKEKQWLFMLRWSDVKPTEDHRRNLAHIGAAGQALDCEWLSAVLPLDEKKTLDAAKGLQPAEQAARHKTQLSRVMTDGHFALIVLDGSHDLTPHLPAGCEYIRVSVAGYNEFAGQKAQPTTQD